MHRTWWLTAGAETGPAGEGRTIAVRGADRRPAGLRRPAAEPVGGQRDRPATVRDRRHGPGAEDARGRLDHPGMGEPDEGEPELEATTVDGERRVSAVVELTRRAAP